MALTLADLILRVGADTAEMKAGLAEVTREARKTARDLESLGSGLQSIGGAMTAAITAPLAAVSVAALKMSGDLEQAAVAFKTLLGSADAARVHLEQLKDFALKTPFQFPDLVQASKRLQALGFTAREVIPTLTAVGNAAAAMGTGAEGIQRITLALGQMQAKGKVQAEEMRQLAESGIPAWDILAKAISKAEGKVVSISETMKLVEKRMVDASFGTAAIIAGINDRFAGLMEDQSKTLMGVFSNLKDRINFVLADIGDALAPMARRMLDSFSGVLKEVDVLAKRFTNELSPVTQDWIIKLTGGLALGGPVLVGIGILADKLGQLWALITKLVGSTAAFEVLGRTIVGVFTAIEVGKLLGQFAEMIGNIKTLLDQGGFLETWGKSIASTFASLSDTLGLNSKAWIFLREAVTFQWDVLLNPIKVAFDSINRYLGLFTHNLKEATDEAQRQIDRINKASFTEVKPNVKNTNLLPNFAAEDEEKDRRTRESIEARAKAMADAAAKAAAKYQTAVSQAFSAFGEENTAGLADKLTKAFNLLDKNDLFNNADQRARALAMIADATEGITKQMAKLRAESLDLSKAMPKTFEEFAAAVSSGRLNPEATLKKMQAALKEFGEEWRKLPPHMQGVRVELDLNIRALEAFIAKLNQMDLDDAMRKADDAISRMAANFKHTFEEITPTVAQFFKAFKVPDDVAAEMKQTVEDMRALGITEAQIRKKGVEEIIAANLRVQESDKYTAEQKVIAHRTAWNVVIAETKRAADEAIGMDKLRLEQHLRMLEEQRRGEGKFYTDLRDELRRVSDDLTTALSRAVFDWKNFGDSLKKIFQDLGASIIKNLLDNVFHVQEAMNALTESMVDFLKGAFGSGVSKSAGSLLPGSLSDVLKGRVPTTTGGTVPGGIGGGPTGSIKGTVSDPAGGGIINSLGGLGGALNVATGIASAITDVMSLLVGRRVEQDVGRIEVTTRGMLNQLISIQETLNQWLPAAANLGPYFDSLKIGIGQLGEIFTDRLGELYNLIRSLGGIGGGGGGGGQGGDGGGEEPTYNKPVFTSPTLPEVPEPTTLAGIPTLKAPEFTAWLQTLLKDIQNMSGAVTAGRGASSEEFENLRTQLLTMAHALQSSIAVGLSSDVNVRTRIDQIGQALKDLNSAVDKGPKEGRAEANALLKPIQDLAGDLLDRIKESEAQALKGEEYGRQTAGNTSSIARTTSSIAQGLSSLPAVVAGEAAANAPLGDPNATKYVEPPELRWINSWDQVHRSLASLAESAGLTKDALLGSVGPMVDLTQAIKNVVATEMATIGPPGDPFAMIRNDAWVGLGSERDRYQQATQQPLYFQGGDYGSLGPNLVNVHPIGRDLNFNIYDARDPVVTQKLIGEHMELLNITR